LLGNFPCISNYIIAWNSDTNKNPVLKINSTSVWNVSSTWKWCFSNLEWHSCWYDWYHWVPFIID